VCSHLKRLRTGDRSDLLQLLNDGLLANVPGVENLIDPFEMSPDGRVEQAVGVGNHSDENDLNHLSHSSTLRSLD
jgi:hypothetical protein